MSHTTKPSPLVLLEGFSLLNRPGIRGFVLAPLCFNVILFCGLFYWAYHFTEQLQQALANWLPSWLALTSFLIWPIAAIVALLLILYGFAVLANLLAAPFNAFLAQACAKQQGYRVVDNTSLGQQIQQSFVREWQKFWYSLPWWILALILSFLPMMNILSLLISAWLLALAYLDYPADNQQLSFRQMLKRMKTQRLAVCGFGASILLASLVPVVNFFLMPAAVCSATLFWHRRLALIE